MGDADLLRRLADKLEAVAREATGDRLIIGSIDIGDSMAIWIKLMHPDIAVPLAAWLRAEANTTGRCAARHMRITARAEAFAKAILREDQ